MRELEDRARVIPHAPDEEGVEDEGNLGCFRRGSRRGDRLAEADEVRDDLIGDALGQRLADLPLAVGDVLAGLRAAQELFECVHGRGRRAALAELGRHTVGADLVELVDRDQHARAFGIREAEAREHRVQRTAVVDAHGRSREPQSVEGVERRGDQLGLGAGSRVADDVDVALHELAVATLLRPLGTPHRRDLNGPEDRRKLGAVRGVEPRERHGEVVAKARGRRARRGRPRRRGCRRRRDLGAGC